MIFAIDLENDFDVKIGAHTWRVVYVDGDGFSSDSTPWGLCEAQKQLIRINKSASPSMRLSTFWHEAMHALEAIYEIEIPHMHLNLVGDAIAQMMIDSFAAPAKKAKK